MEEARRARRNGIQIRTDDFLPFAQTDKRSHSSSSSSSSWSSSFIFKQANMLACFGYGGKKKIKNPQERKKAAAQVRIRGPLNCEADLLTTAPTCCPHLTLELGRKEQEVDEMRRAPPSGQEGL